jgi:signal transduction histidine kinase/tetratricopeptide (TPR) repeat protein
LKEESRALFSYAACLGNRFNLEMLSIISGYPVQKCRSLLLEGQGKSMLLTLSFSEGDHTGINSQDANFITFLHDKVQQAAFKLIEQEKIPYIFLKIGYLLLARLSPAQLDERFYEVVNKLNAGAHLIEDSAEKVKLVNLNLTAAGKAYTATAYNSALQFCREASMWLKEHDFSQYMWLHHHELTMNLFKEWATCEFVEGDRHQAEKCVQEAVIHSRSALEKARMFNILIIHYTLSARYPEAIESGRKALSFLGISLPGNGYEEARDVEIALVKKRLENRSVASLFDLPVMEDPEMVMASSILIAMGPPCYRSHQRLWSVIVPKVVNLTLQFGNIPLVGYSHTAFGGLIGWVEDDYSTAKEFSELATQLMTNTFRSPSDQSIFYLMIGSSIRHWFKHLSYSTHDYTDAYEIGLRSGNLQYAAYAFGHNMYCRFFQGVSFSILMLEVQYSLDFSRTRMNQWAIDLLEGGLHVFGIVSNQDLSLNGDIDWSDESFLQQIEEHNNIQVKCIYNVLKTFVLLVAGDNERALKCSDETKPIIYTVGIQGLYPWAEYVFIRFMILSALSVKGNKQVEYFSELEHLLKRLAVWSDHGPDNFLHKYCLASAEMARIKKNTEEAVKFYDKAIALAHSGNFIQWEGLANERAYQFWLELGNIHIADVYWRQAYVCYHRWGAFAKVLSMEKMYRMHMMHSFSNMQKERYPFNQINSAFQEEVVEHQVGLLRNYAHQMQQTRLLFQAEEQAGELARATQRLRIEIAQRKKADEEISTKNDELQKLNATKDKFFSIIAHDLKSPFNSIVGFSNMLYSSLEKSDREEDLRYADVIRRSSQKAMDLLMNLMEWARSQTGRMKFNPEYFDLGVLIKEIELLFEEIAKQKRIRISNTLPSSAISVYADRTMLSIILRNLISNGIKFTKPMGRITISIEKKADELLVAVADTGIGISKTNLDKLFRIDDNYTTVGTKDEEGTGLGLVLCKEFIESHGGEIWVESEPEKGSVFIFSLPHSRR